MAEHSDLAELHNVAASVLELLAPAQRTKMLRAMSRDIRTVNQRRMAAQVAPDGSPWPRRKARRVQKAANRPIRFLYPAGGVGDPRLVEMRSWRGNSDYMIGFDREADGLRTFRKDKVIRYIHAEGSAEDGPVAEERGGRGRVRRQAQAMFRGLRSSRWLKAGADADSAWAGYAGKAARLAGVHHYGLRDRVTADGPEADYPERELIGFAPSDETMILNAFIDRAGDVMGWGRRTGH